MAQKYEKIIPLMGDYEDAKQGVVIPKELKMRRPKVKDQINAQRLSTDDGSMEIVMFANLCEQTTDVIEELEICDYSALQKAYTDFTQGKHLAERKNSDKPA